MVDQRLASRVLIAIMLGIFVVWVALNLAPLTPWIADDFRCPPEIHGALATALGMFLRVFFKLGHPEDPPASKGDEQQP